MLDLHTRQDKADWEYVSQDEQTHWQRLAAKTHGFVTPANAITIIGFGLVLVGLGFLGQERYALGLSLCAVGRMADVLDGIIAAKTNTKSAIGEQLDLIADKLTVLAAVIVLIFWFDVSFIIVGLLVLINSLNALATLLVKLRGSTKHPSRAGKYAMALCWIIILLLFIEGARSTSAVQFLLYVATVLYACVGGWASYHYLAPLARQK